MAQEAKYPAYINFVTDEDQRREVDAIAEKEKVSIGAVARELMHLGLKEYHKKGGPLFEK